MQFTFQTKQLLPEETYYANFKSVEQYQNEQFGEGLKWSFTITDGENKGKTINRITGTKPTPNNACGRMLIGLLGKTPGEGESVDISKCIGQKYICTFSGKRIETVARMPE